MPLINNTHAPSDRWKKLFSCHTTKKERLKAGYCLFFLLKQESVSSFTNSRMKNSQGPETSGEKMLEQVNNADLRPPPQPVAPAGFFVERATCKNAWLSFTSALPWSCYRSIVLMAPQQIVTSSINTFNPFPLLKLVSHAIFPGKHSVFTLWRSPVPMSHATQPLPLRYLLHSLIIALRTCQAPLYL